MPTVLRKREEVILRKMEVDPANRKLVASLRHILKHLQEEERKEQRGCSD
jgi:ribosomal protein S1